MSKDKRQKIIFWTVLFSEAGHVFCCVLPSIFSMFAILVGTGVVSAMPASWVLFHDVMHKYEIPMIAFSAVILAAGWGLYFYSKRIDCHDTGCTHGPCDKKKIKTSTLLSFATLLFAVNITIYLISHVATDFDIPATIEKAIGVDHPHNHDAVGNHNDKHDHHGHDGHHD